MAWKSSETLIRRNLKLLRGDNISAIRSGRHETAPRIEKDESFKKTKFYEFLLQKKIREGGLEAGDLLKRTVPAMNCASLNYFVMQYLFNTKNQVKFDPIGALSHFVVPGTAESPGHAEPLEAMEQSSQGQGNEETSTGKSTLTRGVGSPGFSCTRLEILKMRASRRPTRDDSKDSAQLE